MSISSSGGLTKHREVARLLSVAIATIICVSPRGSDAMIIMIDDLDTGSVNLSSIDSVGDIQTESSLPPTSVIAGYRRTDFTSTLSSAVNPTPATLTSGAGLVSLNSPGGPGAYYTNYVTFTYNAGQSSFPSTGLGLDLSQVAQFTVVMAQLAGPTSVQLQLLNSMANSSSATKSVFSAGPVTFEPSDFTSGVWPTVHTIRLNLQYSMRPEYTQPAAVDALFVEAVPEPVTVGLLACGLLLMLTRRRGDR